MDQAQVIAVLKKKICDVLPDITDRQIELSQELKDLGANSVDRVEILTLVMEELKISKPMTQFGSARTIQEIASVFCR